MPVRLHDEVPAAVDRRGDQLGHPLLARPLLGARQRGGDGGEVDRGVIGRSATARRRQPTSASAASSSAASNSGQGLSVKWIAAPALCQRRKFETRCSPDVRTSTSTGGSSGR